MKLFFQVDEDFEEERMDVYLREQLEDISRSKIAKAIKDGEILLNDEIAKASSLLKIGDRISFDDDIFDLPPIEKEDFQLDILYEDENILAINKPYDMVVHPTLHIRSHTLVNQLLDLSCPLSDLSGKERPGIVHRLDQDTTGVLLVAKNNASHMYLKKLFQERKIKKNYVAILQGRGYFKKEKVDQAIGRNPYLRKKMAIDPNGKEAISYFTSLRLAEKYTFAKVELVTGRTHQIRVHAQFLNHPILGDLLYGRKDPIKTSYQMLHANEISFPNSLDGKIIRIQAPIWDEMQRVLQIIPWMDH